MHLCTTELIASVTLRLYATSHAPPHICFAKFSLLPALSPVLRKLPPDSPFPYVLDFTELPTIQYFFKTPSIPNPSPYLQNHTMLTFPIVEPEVPSPSPLKIYEILHRTLWYLPIQDLPACYEVCRLWRDVIDKEHHLWRRRRFARLGFREADGGFRKDNGVWVRWVEEVGGMVMQTSLEVSYGGG